MEHAPETIEVGCEHAKHVSHIILRQVLGQLGCKSFNHDNTAPLGSSVRTSLRVRISAIWRRWRDLASCAMQVTVQDTGPRPAFVIVARVAPRRHCANRIGLRIILRCKTRSHLRAVFQNRPARRKPASRL
jgi:hypothetical protein